MPTVDRRGTRRLDLAGRVCLVTGAAQGIGLESVRAFAARGAAVALLDQDGDRLRGCPAMLPEGRAHTIEVDVRDRAGMAAAVEEVVQRFGRLDVVVANAGVTPRVSSLRTMDPADYDRVVGINLTGVFNTVHPSIEHVIAAGGHITLVASMAAMLPGPLGSPYMITKAGVEQLGRALRIELAAHGASAGVSYFGIVATSMTRSAVDNDPIGSALEQQLPRPLRRRISAQDAATAIVDGVQARAARTIAPQAWTLLAWLRGVTDRLVDASASRDRRLHELIVQSERETSAGA